MKWHLFKADKNRAKWSIRGTLYNGEDVKIPASTDEVIAREMLRNVERLNRAKAINDVPPAEILTWLDVQPQEFVDRLVGYGLVDIRRLDRRLPIASFLPKFKKFLTSNTRKANSTYPAKTVRRIERILANIEGQATFNTLTVEQVKFAVREMKVLTRERRGQNLSQKSVREHYSAIKLFAEWVRTDVGAVISPLSELKLPAAKGNRVYNRRPFTHEEFNRLLSQLQTRKPSRLRDRYWNSHDQTMLYWAAVCTGFRQQELLTLTRASFNFNACPATVTVTGQEAKNGCTDTIPIPQDFANAMNAYTSDRLPGARAFRAPKTSQPIIRALYRDLAAACVERQFPNGDVRDFHAFRSTAICWWLLSGKSLIEVMFLARLKTLDLVQEYVRRYMPDFKHLVADSSQIDVPLIAPKLAG